MMLIADACRRTPPRDALARVDAARDAASAAAVTFARFSTAALNAATARADMPCDERVARPRHAAMPSARYYCRAIDATPILRHADAKRAYRRDILRVCQHDVFSDQIRQRATRRRAQVTLFDARAALRTMPTPCRRHHWFILSAGASTRAAPDMLRWRRAMLLMFR